MKKEKHWAIFIDNTSNIGKFTETLFSSSPANPFESLSELRGALFSKLTLLKFIDEESRHGHSGIPHGNHQSLHSMSSGEQKRVLLHHLLESKPDYLVLDNPFDNLDKQFQEALQKQLNDIAKHTTIIQIISRKDDLLPFIANYAKLEGNTIIEPITLESLTNTGKDQVFTGNIPQPLKPMDYKDDLLIQLNNVNVSYSERPILENITWHIGKGEFWELSGPNGSGKTTILSMITGENPKGYGQELYLFGNKKGSGESIWDIKKNIGYFTPSMTDKFTGYHTLEHMLISGILDSIGLYVQPTEAQLRLAKEWLQLIDMWHLKDTLFHDLTMGQKRLVMTTRAMVKHPLLLILDEPTAGLDDESAALLVSLVNKIAKESQSTIIFVSHRTEPNLLPQYKFVLQKTKEGSKGLITKS
ncbi:ATP-binding cassette domain-containing protein [Maribacter sp. ANRC-HE7]|uniref:ATP-binding cassette domain-containing protein n=1 Tax=Maribacter aquimaris TaxID=2737171 RepID=A0ABR7UZL2_9FLAO|nr:ATP-binding cassette domain-containing protein [Maribacter aquimaris]MBD0778034.1 ATP-binding cassette domain-containing protein [Maribacter aquimaris]